MSKRRLTESSAELVSAGAKAKLELSILTPLKWENDVLRRLLYNARNAHRRKTYWVQTKHASVLIDNLITQLRSSPWGGGGFGGVEFWPDSASAAELRQAVDFVLSHVEEAARCWRESLIVFGFFANLAETTFAALARQVKLLTQFRRQWLGFDKSDLLADIPFSQQQAQTSRSPKKLRSKDSLTLFLERIEERT
eukprot:Gregarina_sp_Pseudo_9__2992@NODE_3200_length_719_cov_19_813235_g2919_i0_p1_GENE_NODE_3200_length_719_cov_19_813235_g2919_i0NODE_3200_length_719_cov_19_813235_g2919_i0_p1_ORF_typecomplete_len195_score33_02DUF4477/PF14780_6/0_0037DUF4477/PF14780_6/26DUF4477/PF14780_6/5_8e03Gly_kinase/PF02595_15/0_21_NODE_3200_length_719_cov_19_813235_g2919_i080664